MNMNITARAKNVARIFDILAWIVLGFGVIGAGLYFLITVGAGISEDEFLGGLVVGTLGGFFILVYTALVWASVTLGTIIAGYIASKTDAGSDYRTPATSGW